MKYQNTKTGFVLDTNCKIEGENWQKLDSSLSSDKKKDETPKKRGNK